MSSTSRIQPLLRGWLAADFSLHVKAVEPVTGGLDPSAAVWAVTDEGGRLWAVKWTRRDNRFGLLLASALADSSVAGVPRQLRARSGEPWTDHEGGRLSVSAWVAGREAYETGLDADEWRSLGYLLRRVHEEPPPDVPGADDASAVRKGIRRAGARTRRRLRQIDDLVSQHADAPDTDPAVTRLVHDWPKIRPRIDALRRAAARLRIERRPTDRVSCHGDPHLGNVLVDDAGQPWLIDFDDAVQAPREVDLMLIELGVLFTLPVSDDDRAAFHSGYGPARLDADRIVRFGSVRAVEDIVQATRDLLLDDDARDPAALEALIAGVLSPDGLAGLVEARLRTI